MNMEEKDIDAIRDYWKNNLEEGERQVLEQRMEDDPVFREEVDAQRLLLLAVKSRGDSELWAWVQDLHEQMKGEPPNTPPSPPPVPKPAPKPPFWSSGAGFVVLGALLLIAWLWLSQSPGSTSGVNNSTETKPNINSGNGITTPSGTIPKSTTPKPPKPKPKVYAELSRQNMIPPNFVHLKNTKQSAHEMALAHWDNKQYAKARQTLKPNRDSLSVESLKLLAHSTYKMGFYEEAANYFALIEERSYIEQKDAQWNRLMCYGALLPKSRALFDKLAKQIQMTSKEKNIVKKFAL